MTGALLYRAAALSAVGAAVLGAAAWARPAAAIARAAWGLGAALVAAVTAAAWGLRLAEVGHLPLFGTYESALSVALAVSLASLAWERRAGFRAGVAPLGALVVALLLAQGLRFDPTPFALTISERSWVVDVHAIVAWAAFGLLAANAAAAVRVLSPGGEAQAPALLRTLEVGFVLHSAMLASGSIYKFLLFGSAWSFDPVETLGLAAWAGYATLLHLQLLAAWTPRRLAAWCLLAFAVLAVSYRCLVYFPGWATYHVFDVSLRLH